MKLVSVLIPAYNHENYIKECICSVINQTYKNLEILILDDCSTDNTAKEINKIKDKRIKKYFSKENRGVVYSINKLLEHASGDYIAIIGSDDVWYPTKIEKQVKYIEKLYKKNISNVGCVFTETDIINENSEIFEDSQVFNVFKNENVSRYERIKLFYEIGNHLCHSSSLMPKKVFEDIGFYNNSFRQLHDYEYWTRLIQKYDIHILNEKLMGYRRIDNGSLSSSNLKNTIRQLNEMFFINSRLIANLTDEDFKKVFVNDFKKNIDDKDFSIECEKFFKLLNMNYLNSYNKCYAFEYFILNERKMINKLLKYDFKVNDLYCETGNVMVKYFCVDEIEREKKEIEEYYLNIIEGVNKSISWKVTKPLRWLKEIMRRVK